MAKKMFNHLEVSVTASTTNEAHPHGLGVIPTFVILTHGTNVDVSIGSTPADLTNIYLTNVNVGDQPAKVFVFDPHTIIDG